MKAARYPWSSSGGGSFPLGLRRKMRLFGRERIEARHVARCGKPAFAQQRAQGDGSQADAAFLEEPAAGDQFAIIIEEVFLLGHGVILW